jgi:exosortase E/protease (VPEID-CTERM system)
LVDENSIIAREEGPGFFGNTVSLRCCWLALFVAIECILIRILHLTSAYARYITPPAFFFLVVLLFFGRDRLKGMRWNVPPVRKGWVASHLAALVLFGASTVYFKSFTHPSERIQVEALWIWCICFGLILFTLGGSLFGLRELVRLLRGLGGAWGLAALCSALLLGVGSLLKIAWSAQNSHLGRLLQMATLRGVAGLLRLFYHGVFFDPAHYLVGTETFRVEVEYLCSGIEGLALILSLTVCWLIYARRELRMARALLLVPFSLALIWLLNLVRLATLIAIGSAGYSQVARGGFHSQAGWILLCSVALGFLLTVNNVRWFHKPAFDGQQPLASQPSIFAQSNSAAVYLLPFLAILAAGLLSQAVSDGFEWLYVLRLVAALGVLYAYRSRYLQMDWRFGWLGLVAGIVVFALWVSLDRVTAGEGLLRNLLGGHAVPDNGVVLTSIGEGLARLSRRQRTAWIAVRAVTAVTTVPLAEELAFRGFVARRIVSPNVDEVSYRSLSVTAVLVSSLIFGVLHGSMWLAGLLAGAIFALLAKQRGRLGEAVAAHATANLLIALWVIARGDYSLW